MSTNNSKCWYPAIVLGLDKTSATCSAVVGTTEVYSALLMLLVHLSACSAVVGTTEVKEQHRESRMHLESHATGPAVPPVHRHDSTPMASHLMQLLAA